MKLTIEKAKQIAMKDYEKGGDVFVECYTDEELAEYVEGKTIGDLRQDMKDRKEILDDRAGW